jgi:serine/threonine protein kinase
VTTKVSESVEEQLLDDSSLGITFSSFQILEVLGEGSFGKVYKVILKTNNQKTFAMKVLNK